MIIKQDIALRNFKPWAGAKAVFNRLTTDELDTLEDLLNDLQETWDETEINDTFWFEDVWICEALGIKYKEFWEREA